MLWIFHALKDLPRCVFWVLSIPLSSVFSTMFSTDIQVSKPVLSGSIFLMANTFLWKLLVLNGFSRATVENKYRKFNDQNPLAAKGNSVPLAPWLLHNHWIYCWSGSLFASVDWSHSFGKFRFIWISFTLTMLCKAVGFVRGKGLSFSLGRHLWVNS